MDPPGESFLDLVEWRSGTEWPIGIHFEKHGILCVDFAAESGFPYMLLDAGLSEHDITEMRCNVDVPELVQYAAKKHVKMWM